MEEIEFTASTFDSNEEIRQAVTDLIAEYADPNGNVTAGLIDLGKTRYGHHHYLVKIRDGQEVLAEVFFTKDPE